MSNARQSWSWNGCDGNAAIVEVYARAARVDLFINGKKVGSRRVKAGRLVQFCLLYTSSLPGHEWTGRMAAYDYYDACVQTVFFGHVFTA